MHTLSKTLILIAVALVGCGSPESSKKELIVLCGSSFTPPCNELIEKFTKETGIEIVTTVAGSEDFLPLIKAGNKGDILISHDPFVEHVKKEKQYMDHVNVGFVAPVVAVQKGNPKGIKTLQDLTKPGLRVALSDPRYSTCGEMVYALLEKKGMKDQVLANVGTRLTKGHSQLGTFLKTGVVDVVIMWNGVANTFKDSVDVVKMPYEYDKEKKVFVLGLNYSKNKDEVKQFLAFVETHGSEIFKGKGYEK